MDRTVANSTVSGAPDNSIELFIFILFRKSWEWSGLESRTPSMPRRPKDGIGKELFGLSPIGLPHVHSALRAEYVIPSRHRVQPKLRLRQPLARPRKYPVREYGEYVVHDRSC